ncbi:MAG: hypothetical protein JWN66_296 [Sphingomonas bacterium]|uniref:hypothetical protein n=1 Tax=Sphingomonas bacterium TaxID=1895847 RepID=UPI002636862F|nr:hypothetical protein [Sphingomonas bacterium]MDB5703180.1 hypothetical protein [Sphingomonas bacterium]
MPSQSTDAERAKALTMDLWYKREALVDFLQKLNEEVMPDDAPDYEGLKSNAYLEIQRIDALRDMVQANIIPPFPTDEQIAALQQSVGELQQAVERSQHVDDLIGAATVAIKTWPVSGGG